MALTWGKDIPLKAVIDDALIGEKNSERVIVYNTHQDPGINDQKAVMFGGKMKWNMLNRK